METWKPIEGYETLYEVSDRGAVRALPRAYVTGNGAKRTHGCFVMKMHPNGNGYLSVVLHKDGAGKTCRVHKLVAAAFLGISSLEINHKNGIKADNTLKNLEYCTRSENIKHAYAKGLIKFCKEQRGENNHAAKLKIEDVLKIRRLYEETQIRQKELARNFGVSPVTINDIIKKRRWAHV
ncbi:MAG: NUMOD4 domain-containing protein [Phycisphaerae bacterium]|jgi:DNA-binding XRE family transcriptional regulator